MYEHKGTLGKSSTRCVKEVDASTGIGMTRLHGRRNETGTSEDGGSNKRPTTFCETGNLAKHDTAQASRGMKNMKEFAVLALGRAST